MDNLALKDDYGTPQVNAQIIHKNAA